MIVMGADYILGDIYVDGEKLMAITNSYDGSLLEGADLQKLQKDIKRLLELLDNEFISNYNATKKKECYDEWVRMNEGLGEFAIEKRSIPINESNVGYVYVIKEYFSNTFKIGMTSKIKERQSTFGVTLPFDWDFQFIYVSSNHELLEKRLHEKFSEVRVKGEWFTLTPDDIAFLSTTIHSNTEFSELITEVMECPKND